MIYELDIDDLLFSSLDSGHFHIGICTYLSISLSLLLLDAFSNCN